MNSKFDERYFVLFQNLDLSSCHYSFSPHESYLRDNYCFSLHERYLRDNVYLFTVIYDKFYPHSHRN